MEKVFLMLGVGVVAVLISACTPDAPEVREFDVELQHGSEASVLMDPDFIEIEQNDTLILKVVSYQKGMLHVHGYDLALMVDQASTAVLEFEAVTTGRFEVMFHAVALEVTDYSGNSLEDDSDATSDGGDAHHSGDARSSDQSVQHEFAKTRQSADQLVGYLQVMPR